MSKDQSKVQHQNHTAAKAATRFLRPEVHTKPPDSKTQVCYHQIQNPNVPLIKEVEHGCQIEL